MRDVRVGKGNFERLNLYIVSFRKVKMTRVMRVGGGSLKFIVAEDNFEGYASRSVVRVVRDK